MFCPALHVHVTINVLYFYDQVTQLILVLLFILLSIVKAHVCQ